MNSIRLSGLVSRVQNRTTRIKQPMLTFTLSGITKPDSEGRSIIFHRYITAFGDLARRYAQMPDNFAVELEGRLTVRTWTEQGGTEKRVISVNPNTITPIPTPKPKMIDANPKGSDRLKNAINTISLSGVITREPKFQFLPNGTAQTRLHLEVEGGSIPVDIWGEELAIEYAQFAAGETVLVTGVLRPMSNKDKDGNTIDTTRIDADSITLHTPEPPVEAEAVPA